MTRLPRLLDGSMNEVRRIHPINGSLNLEIVPLSTATLTILPEESFPVRSWVEMYTPFGSAGIYRSRAPSNEYGDDVTTIELEHGITEVGDSICDDDIEESTTLKAALEKLWTYYKGSLWTLGTITQTDTVLLDVDHDNMLEAILSLLEQTPNYMLTFDFTSTPWTVGLASRDTTVSAEGRLGRNVENAAVSYDDSELCTRVYIPYDNDGEETYAVHNADATTITRYGVIEKLLPGSSYTYDQAAHVANVYLNKHKKPQLGVDIDGVELSNITGESLDSFRIGKLFRLAVPKYSITVEDCITAINYDDLYSEDKAVSVTVSLADAEDAVVRYVRQQATKQNSARRSGGRGGRKQAEENKDFWTAINRNDYMISLEAYQRVYGDEFNHSELMITASYIRSTVEETANGLYSRIEQTASYLQSEIVDTASGLQSQINQTASQIALKVSKGDVATQLAVEAGNVSISGGDLVVDGYVTSAGLSAAIGDLDTLVAKSIIITGGGSLSTTGYIAAAEVKTSTLTLGGNSVTGVLTDASVSNNTLTITKSTGATVTFSKATTLLGGWNSGRFTVTADPQGNTYYTDLDIGQVTWDGNIATVPINAHDNSQSQYSRPTGEEVTVDASARYNAGVTKGHTDYTGADASVGNQVQGQTWYVNFVRNDGSSQLLEVNMSSVYAKAREGYTLGTFTLTSVTPQGQSTSAYVEDANGTSYYQAGSSATYYKGNGTKYSAVTRYKGDGGSFVARGDSVTRYEAGSDYTHYLRNTTATRFSHYMQVELYRKTGTSSYTSAGNYDWWYKVSSGGTAYYTSDGTANGTNLGSSGTYYRGNGGTKYDRGSTESCLVSDENGAYVTRGETVTVTPITGSALKLSAATLYEAGQAVADTYYTKS